MVDSERRDFMAMKRPFVNRLRFLRALRLFHQIAAANVTRRIEAQGAGVLLPRRFLDA